VNRRFKFPCAYKHYQTPPKGSDGKDIFWSTEECEKMYDPHCVDCRDNYKRPSNNSLFWPHWWAYTYRFDWWIFSKGYYDGKNPWFIGMWKRLGFWRSFRYACYGRSHYDQYQSLRLPFVSVHWAPLEFSDIREYWHDLSEYYPAKPFKKDPMDNYNETTQHLIKVAYRFQRMWEKELKEKLNCREGSGETPCQFGTWGCTVKHNEVKK
jgi:hypothetical protein